MLYPGTLNWHQGLDIAIRAFALIKDQAPEAEFHIYGDGPLKNKLSDLINELGLEQNFDVDIEKFPLVKISRQALEEGKSLPIALNAANEIAVESFLRKKIRFTDITDIISAVMEAHDTRDVEDLEEILDVDRETRSQTRDYLNQRFKKC